MATIPYTRATPDSLHATCVIVAWADMANGDDGVRAELANFADRSVQVSGTFGTGGAVVIEGSIDGVNYATLTDPQGNALSITEAKIESIAEVVRYVRPRVPSGDGTTALTVTMLMKGPAK